MRKGQDIAERLDAIAVGVLRVVEGLKKSGQSKNIGAQLARAVTSSGANYEEARRAESRADFIHKVGVAAKEMAEAGYWLRLASRLELTPSDVSGLLREGDELVAILVSSARTAKQNA